VAVAAVTLPFKTEATAAVAAAMVLVLGLEDDEEEEEEEEEDDSPGSAVSDASEDADSDEGMVGDACPNRPLKLVLLLIEADSNSSAKGEASRSPAVKLPPV
jgi:hypothetical protein